MSGIHHTPEYQRCVRELKSRGRYQRCMTCDTICDARARKGSPNAMTLGHIIDADVAPELAYVPSNYAAQCGPCNYAGGARRTNAKRAGTARSHTSKAW